jgi:hypothetical protein
MRTPARSPRASFCLGLMFGLLCPFVFLSSLGAQSDTATLSGRIADQTGAAVNAVEVTVVNTNSGTKIETDTNDSGIYVVPDLHPGPYDVTVEKSGFRKVVLTGLSWKCRTH